MAETKYIEIQVSTGNSKREVDSLNRSTKSLGKTTDKTSAAMGKLSKAAVAVASAISVQQVIQYGDAWQTTNNKLANSVRVNEQLADVTQRVFDISQETRTSLDATATLYARLERATREYNVSATQLADLTTVINQGFVVSGATAQEAENAIIQLSQGLASGALRGEEFNSVNEQGNRIIVALADSIGVTTGQMRGLAAQGKLTTDVIVQGLLRQSDAIENEYSKTVATFAQQTQRATDNLTKFIGESTLVTSTIAAAGDTLVFASQNMELFVDIATALAILYTARLTPAIVSNIAAFNAYIATATKATVTTNAFGVKTVQATAAMNAATLATTALSRALALIGGPAGLLVLTIAGMVKLLSLSKDTATSMQKLAEETDKATAAFKGLTQAQAQNKLAEVERDLTEASQSLGGLQQAADDAFAAFTGQLATGRESGLVILEQQANEAAEAVKKAEDNIRSLAAQAGVLQGQISSASTEVSAPAIADTIDISGGKRSVGEAQLEKEKLVTEQLDQELAFRISSFQRYGQSILSIDQDTFEKRRLQLEQSIDAEKFLAEQKFQSDLIRLEEERVALLENDKITNEEKLLIQEEFDAQQTNARLALQQSLTEIEAEGAAARTAIREAEKDAAIATSITLGSNLISSFQGQSRKLFELGKSAAIAGTIISTYESATKAYDAMASIPYIGPALGAAAAAAAIAGGLANVNKIKSTSFNGGGSSGGSTYNSASTPSAGTAPATATAPSAPVTNTVVDLRGVDRDSLVTVGSIVDIINGSTDVAIAINGSTEEARREGLL